MPPELEQGHTPEVVAVAPQPEREMRAGRLGRIARLEASPRVAETVARSWLRRCKDDGAHDECGGDEPERCHVRRSDRPRAEFHSPVDRGDDGPDDEDR